MSKLLPTLLLTFFSLFGAVAPLHVEVNIYKNVSFLTKQYEFTGTKTLTLNVPFQINLENIDIESKGCKKESLSLTKPLSFESKKTEVLETEISNLKDKIATVQEENGLLKTLSLEKQSVQNAQDTLKFFTKNYTSNLETLSLLKQKLTKMEKELQELQKQQAKEYKKLQITFTCRDKGRAKITYPQPNFRVNDFYEIRADVKHKNLQFIKKIKIIQKSGEDFKNIDIISHSNTYNRRVEPTPFYPRYLNVPKKRLLYAKSSKVTLLDNAMVRPVAKSKYIQNLTTSAFVLRGINLPNNQEKIFRVENHNYSVIFENDIDGYGSNLAYLKANFKSDRYYQSSRAYIRLGENQVGVINLNRIKKGEKRDIYFGENQNIKVKKNLLKRYNESEFFGGKQINTQVWQYKITNQSNTTQKINLIERIPISQNEDIEIEPLFDAKKAKINKKGRVVWSFTLTPSETKTIKFGYKTKKPKK